MIFCDAHLYVAPMTITVSLPEHPSRRMELKPWASPASPIRAVSHRPGRGQQPPRFLYIPNTTGVYLGWWQRHVRRWRGAFHAQLWFVSCIWISRHLMDIGYCIILVLPPGFWPLIKGSKLRTVKTSSRWCSKFTSQYVGTCGSGFSRLVNFSDKIGS